MDFLAALCKHLIELDLEGCRVKSCDDELVAELLQLHINQDRLEKLINHMVDGFHELLHKYFCHLLLIIYPAQKQLIDDALVLKEKHDDVAFG